MMMNYEDFYTPNSGPWYSLESMSKQDMIIWFAYIGWFLLNALLLIILTYKWVKKWKTNAKQCI